MADQERERRDLADPGGLRGLRTPGHVILDLDLLSVALAYGAGLAWPILQPYSRWMVPGFMVLFGLGMIFVFLRLLLTKGSPENEDWQRVSVIMIVSVFSIVFWITLLLVSGEP